MNWSQEDLRNMSYHEIINFFIEHYQYKNYLELGVRDTNNTFNKIKCVDKVGVDIDPKSKPTYNMTTDDFFETVGKELKWDIIFIDACHEKNQVYKDFYNSLSHLNDNGIIVMDDINPFTLELLKPEFCDNAWEVFAELRTCRNDLEMFSIYSSFCGVIKKGFQKICNLKLEKTFEFLDQNRDELMNVYKWEDIKYNIKNNIKLC